MSERRTCGMPLANGGRCRRFGSSCPVHGRIPVDGYDRMVRNATATARAPKIPYAKLQANLARALGAIRRRQFSPQHARDSASLAVLTVVVSVLRRIEAACVDDGSQLTAWLTALQSGEVDAVAWVDELLTGETRGSKTKTIGLRELVEEAPP